MIDHETGIIIAKIRKDFKNLETYVHEISIHITWLQDKIEKQELI